MKIFALVCLINESFGKLLMVQDFKTGHHEVEWKSRSKFFQFLLSNPLQERELSNTQFYQNEGNDKYIENRDYQQGNAKLREKFLKDFFSQIHYKKTDYLENNIHNQQYCDPNFMKQFLVEPRNNFKALKVDQLKSNNECFT